MGAEGGSGRSWEEASAGNRALIERIDAAARERGVAGATLFDRFKELERRGAGRGSLMPMLTGSSPRASTLQRVAELVGVNPLLLYLSAGWLGEGDVWGYVLDRLIAGRPEGAGEADASALIDLLAAMTGQGEEQVAEALRTVRENRGRIAALRAHLERVPGPEPAPPPDSSAHRG